MKFSVRKMEFKRFQVASLVCVLVLVVVSLSIFLSWSYPESLKIITKSQTNNKLTLWTILRDLKQTDSSIDQLAWLELLHTYNAVHSWALLEGVDVILFGSDTSCELVQNSFNFMLRVRCHPIPCIDEDLKVPRYDCLFARAAELAETEFIMYTNSDMIYFNDLMTSLQKVADSFYDFLIVGQRLDLVYTERIDFESSTWNETLYTSAKKFGKFHGRYGIDYFIHRTALTRQMPPFVVGRVRWDNWLLAQFIGSKGTATVDATSVLTAIHLNHMKPGLSHNRTGTDFNIGLSIGTGIIVDPKKIGDVESTEYMLVPEEDETHELLNKKDTILKCPKCRFERRQQSVEVMFFKHAVDQKIIIATVREGLVDFALNWHCSLQRLGLNNYIFHTVDKNVYDILWQRNLNVVLFEGKAKQQLESKYHNTSPGLMSDDYKAMVYQATMSAQIELVYRFVGKGYHVLLSDLDLVFLRNPFLFLNESVDTQVAFANNLIAGGLAYARSTQNGRLLWQRIFSKHFRLFAQPQKLKEYHANEITYQKILTDIIIKGDRNLSDISYSRFSEKVIAHGNRFFIKKLTLKKGEWPMAVHNNLDVDILDKQAYFANVSLWFLQSHNTCRQFQDQAVLPKSKFSLTIKVITYDRPVALSRLLTSLSAESYLFDKINLDIFIDSPDETKQIDSESEANRLLVIQTANAFSWAHGKKEVIIRSKHYGLVGQWLNCWFPQSNSEFALILEDDNAMAKGFYAFSKAAINHFFFTKENFDPRVFAFNLQHQHMIAGRYPSRPSEFLPPGTLFYKYQLLSTWGPIFSAWHWGQFITWFAQREENPNFLPLFSNLVTNAWFLKRGKGKSIWSAYFIRFAAERGLYSIYTNFPNNESFVVNYREKGVNFGESKGTNSPNVKIVTPEMMQFPPGLSLPIYDFQFNQITENASILEDRAFYADPSLS